MLRVGSTPPDFVTVGGRNVPIASGFRTGILFSQLLAEPRAPGWMRVAAGLRLYFGEDAWRDAPETYWQEAVRFFLASDEDTAQSGCEINELLFDYEIDGPLLYAAFLTQYGVDLCDSAMNIHWWKFRALMNGLLPEHAFSRRVALRALPLSQVADPAERARLARMKARVRLPGADSGRMIAHAGAVFAG